MKNPPVTFIYINNWRLNFFLFAAEVIPLKTTYSTSIGQSITLAVTYKQHVDLQHLRWKHNDGSTITAWNGLSVVQISNVRKADEGVYECFVENRRELGLHAIMRLVVQGNFNQKFVNVPIHQITKDLSDLVSTWSITPTRIITPCKAKQ